MTPASESQRQAINAFSWGMPPFLGTPLAAFIADVNGGFFQSVAGAQKEWADFVNRRVREDVALAQQLLGCHSLADMHDVYSNYLRKAVDHYQEQSQRAAQRAQATAEELTEAADSRSREGAQRARH